jgi:hypothetical protein
MFYWGTVTVHYFICVMYLDLSITRARILGKMDYFYFLRHVYETCL